MTATASNAAATSATPDVKLTPQQVTFFETFGYIGLPGLVADRASKISESFEEVFAARGGGHHGKAHDGKARSCIVPFIDQHEYLCSLLDDPRIHGLLTSLLGEEFCYMGSDGNFYVGDTGWHSDGWHPKRKYLKVAFYLDPITRNTGCLRVIPGSHHANDNYALRVNKEIYSSKDQWGIEGRDVPCMALESQPGDILVFHHNTKHSAFGGSANRRMFTINACERHADEDLPGLRAYINQNERFWIDRAYGEKMIRTATPGRMRHLEQVMANDYELAALTAKARERMSEPARG